MRLSVLPGLLRTSAVKLLLLCLVAFGFVLSPIATMKASAMCTPAQSILGFPTWYQHLPGEPDDTGKCVPRLEIDHSPDADTDELPNLVLPIGIAILEIMVTLGAIVAFVMVLWGSFNFLTALGEPDKAASARKTVQNAAIGLVILLISTQVVSFIGSAVT